MSETFELEGVVLKTIPSVGYEVKLENGHMIIAHVSGKMRLHHIRITTGDKVKVQMSKYDLKKGRITYRQPRKQTLPPQWNKRK